MAARPELLLVGEAILVQLFVFLRDSRFRRFRLQRSRYGSERGFSLLEVLIALVIASLALGALFSGALSGLRSTRISARYEEAVSRARSHLAAIGHAMPITPSEQEGDDGGGFSYRVRVQPVSSTPALFGEPDPSLAPRAVLYDVTVAISWQGDGGPRSVILESARVALLAAATP